MIALEAGCSPAEVVLAVLGVPPSGSWCRGARPRSAASRSSACCHRCRSRGSRLARRVCGRPVPTRSGWPRRSRPRRSSDPRRRALNVLDRPRRRVRRPRPRRGPAGPAGPARRRPGPRPVAHRPRARPARHRARRLSPFQPPTCLPAPTAYLPTCLPACYDPPDPPDLLAFVACARSLRPRCSRSLGPPRLRRATSSPPPCSTTSSSCRRTSCRGAGTVRPSSSAPPTTSPRSSAAPASSQAAKAAPGSSGFELVAGLTVGERNELSFGFGGRTAAVHARHQLLPARRASQRLGFDAIGDARSVLPVVFAGYGLVVPSIGYDDYRRVDVDGKAVVIFSHEPQERLSRSAMNGARPVMESTLAAKEGAARSARRQGAHRHRRPDSPDRPGGLHACFGKDPDAEDTPIPVLRVRRREVQPLVDHVSARQPGPPHRRRPGSALDGAERRDDHATWSS